MSTNTTSDYHGWLELNVTDAMAKWISNGENNKGLYIGAYAVNRPDHEVKLDEIGLVNTKGDDEYQPFMIGYFKGQNFVRPVLHKNRSKRSAMHRRRKSEMMNPLLEARANDHSKSCQIQQLYVSFKDLKWQDWIIAPDGYGAYYCSGECNFPLTAHMNATNHAIVQTLVHLMQPAKVPKPCCAPTKLSPISVLYYLDETNVNLKKYKNMVVKSCGCHWTHFWWLIPNRNSNPIRSDRIVYCKLVRLSSIESNNLFFLYIEFMDHSQLFKKLNIHFRL